MYSVQICLIHMKYTYPEILEASTVVLNEHLYNLLCPWMLLHNNKSVPILMPHCEKEIEQIFKKTVKGMKTIVDKFQSWPQKKIKEGNHIITISLICTEKYVHCIYANKFNSHNLRRLNDFLKITLNIVICLELTSSFAPWCSIVLGNQEKSGASIQSGTQFHLNQLKLKWC